MRYWGFCFHFNSKFQSFSNSPTSLRAPASCLQLQSTNMFRLVWKSDVGVMLSFPPQTRVTFYWRHVLTLQEHCPEPVFGAVWDEVTDPTQTAWISFLTVLLPFRKSPSSVRWAHIHRDWMVPLMVINRVNSPISALKTFLQILWEFGLKTTSTVNIVIFHRRHKETWLHSP